MSPRTLQLLIAFFVCVVPYQARAQEAAPKAGDVAPAGVDKKYFDLSRSKDPKVKGLAERYLSLLKFQEWSTAAGKSPVAKYISHDPDLKHVKLAVSQGNGKDRAVKEFNVDVSQLSKASQSRLKQIDALQKKLDELAANVKPGDIAPAQAGPENPRGPARGAAARAAPGPEAPPPAAPPPAAAPTDPSASDPDPLGFAELPPVAAPGPGPGPAPGPGPEGVNPASGVPAPAAGQPAGAAGRK